MSTFPRTVPLGFSEAPDATPGHPAFSPHASGLMAVPLSGSLAPSQVQAKSSGPKASSQFQENVGGRLPAGELLGGAAPSAGVSLQGLALLGTETPEIHFLTVVEAGVQDPV